MSFSFSINNEFSSAVQNGVGEGYEIIARFAGRSCIWLKEQHFKHPILSLISANLVLMSLAGKVSTYFKGLLTKTSFLSKKVQEDLAMCSFFAIYLAGNYGLYLLFNPGLTLSVTVATTTFVVVLGLRSYAGKAATS